jgi:tRNA(Ile)-lysidine synthase TilS/MesJ
LIPFTQPPWPGTGRRIESQVRKALYTYSLLENAGGIAVALSGGKDSLTMLYMLDAIRGRGFPNFDLHAIHIGGEYTCGAGVQVDALKDLCERMKVNFIFREQKQDPETIECYSCSRERRRLLFNAAKEVGVTTVAFGHHRDDNAQTLMMNLLKKGEFAGMLPKVPMHAYGMTIIRPLIYVKEEEIIHFADQQGFRRIMCRCPIGQNSMRRKVEEMIDEMEAHFPDARQNLARASLEYGSDKASKIPKKMLKYSLLPNIPRSTDHASIEKRT